MVGKQAARKWVDGLSRSKREMLCKLCKRKTRHKVLQVIFAAPENGNKTTHVGACMVCNELNEEVH